MQLSGYCPVSFVTLKYINLSPKCREIYLICDSVFSPIKDFCYSCLNPIITAPMSDAVGAVQRGWSGVVTEQQCHQVAGTWRAACLVSDRVWSWCLGYPKNDRDHFGHDRILTLDMCLGLKWITFWSWRLLKIGSTDQVQIIRYSLYLNHIEVNSALRFTP